MSPSLVSLLLIVSSLFVSLHSEELFKNEIQIVSKQPCQAPHFVLVHGHGGGAWSWYKIQSLMEASGYNVTSLNLKGSGIDLTDSTTIHNFQDYNKPLIDYLQNLSDDKKVILVGHSAGGLSVTDASYKFSNKIMVAVYVSAAMLKHGYMTEQDVEDGFPGLPPTDNTELKIKNRRYLRAKIKSPHLIIRQIIAQEDAVLKKILYRPIPVEAILSARFEGNETERVKRVYIKTLSDEIDIQHQDAMIQRWPPAEVFEVESDHDIITSHPFELFDLLVNVANSTTCY